MDIEKESTTIQDDLIKKILEFPYETLGIQKGGIYGDETFDKEGYLSDSNINALRERLIKYKIIGFEIGNFGEYEVNCDEYYYYAHNIKYDKYYYYGNNSSTKIRIKPETEFCNIKGTCVYSIFIDETGNCYSNYQLTEIILNVIVKDRRIPWAEELFVNPFINWITVYSNKPDDHKIEHNCKWKIYDYTKPDKKEYIEHYRNWVDFIDLKPVELEVQLKNNIDSSRIYNILQRKKIIDLVLDKTVDLNINGGAPHRNKLEQYSIFKNITLAQVEECETEEN